MELMSMMSAERKRKGNAEEASVRVPQEKLDCDPKTVMIQRIVAVERKKHLGELHQTCATAPRRLLAVRSGPSSRANLPQNSNERS